VDVLCRHAGFEAEFVAGCREEVVALLDKVAAVVDYLVNVFCLLHGEEIDDLQL
jgi:hypothetical protein